MNTTAVFYSIAPTPFVPQVVPAPLPERRATLLECIEEMVKAKLNAGRRPVYRYRLENMLLRFARGRQHVDIASITFRDIEEWQNTRSKNQNTRKTEMQRINALFNFAIRRGYCSANPCARLEKIMVEHKAPVIFTPDEATRLLAWIRKWAPWRLAYVALGLFTGIRPTELQRLSWNEVDLKQKIVKIDASASKVRRRRIVPISDNCLAWLKICERDAHPIGHNEHSRMTEMSMQTGIRWRCDILRHSAASYLLAKHEDCGKVSRWLGNSPHILLNHYMELVSKADCKKFWAIVPE